MTATILKRPDEARAFAERARADGKRVAVVLTMGALHSGHMSLVRHARRVADEVIVTVFVNPTQFAPHEDFSLYPRTFERDVSLSEEAGATCIFAPSASDMYPKGDATQVIVSGVSAPLCGRFRPGHFAGVATVVTKFLTILGPSIALFGRKDYQQLQVIRALVRDLFLPVEVVGLPTVRDADGVAQSSRNAYLSLEEREQARQIPRALAVAQQAFAGGERSRGRILELVSGVLSASGLELQYADLLDPDDLSLPDGDDLGERVLLAIAAFSGKTRLIDNVVLGEDASLGELL